MVDPITTYLLMRHMNVLEIGKLIINHDEAIVFWDGGACKFYGLFTHVVSGLDLHVFKY